MLELLAAQPRIVRIRRMVRGDEPCETSYADRKGKYQAQGAITFSYL